MQIQYDDLIYTDIETNFDFHFEYLYGYHVVHVHLFFDLFIH